MNSPALRAELNRRPFLPAAVPAKYAASRNFSARVSFAAVEFLGDSRVSDLQNGLRLTF